MAMKIEIGGDISKAVDAIHTYETTLIKAGKTSQSVSGAVQSSFNKIDAAATKSKTNFTGLSRVIQDLPFGFLGIQNNITQLLPSAGALGLVVSSLTSIITFASVGFSNWTRGLDGASKSAKDNAKSNEEVKRSLREISAELLSADVSKIETLRQALISTELPIKARTKALEEYNKVSDEQNKLSVADLGNINKINTAINSQISLFEKRALVRAAEDKLKDLYKTIFDSEDKLRKAIAGSGKNTAQDVVRNLTDEQKRSLPVLKSVDTAIKGIIPGFENFGVATGQVKEEFVDAEQKIGLSARGIFNTISNARKEILGLFSFIRQQSLEGSVFGNIFEGDKSAAGSGKQQENFFDKFFDIKPDKSKLEKQIIDMAETARDFAEKNFDKFEGLADILIAGTDRDTVEAGRKFWTNFQKGLVDLKFPKNDLLKAIDVKGFFGKEIKIDLIPSIDTKDLDERIRDGFIKETVTNKKPIERTVDVNVNTKNNIKEIDAGLLSDEFTKKFDTAFKNLSLEGFSGIGESIGTAIASGASPIEAAMSSITSVIGDFIAQIGKALIEYGIIKEGLDKVLLGGIAIPGAVAIAAGVAAIAAGNIVKSLKPKKFEFGGIASGPTLGWVGEGINTNRANPEVIAPLDQLRNFFGSGFNNQAQVVVLDTHIRGNKISLIQSRQDRRNRRLGG